MAGKTAAGGMAKASDFEKTALPHLDSVFRAAVALCRRQDQAEDLAQTTFAKALESFGSFEPGTSCKAWLMRILRNTWIDLLRRGKVAGKLLQLDEARTPERPSAEETAWSNARDLLENFSDEDVIRALGELPEDQRLTLYLVDVEGLVHEEVAEIIGVAVGTVKSRTSRARAELRRRLQGHAADLGLTGRVKP